MKYLRHINTEQQHRLTNVNRQPPIMYSLQYYRCNGLSNKTILKKYIHTYIHNTYIYTYICIRTHMGYAYVGNRDKRACMHTHTHTLTDICMNTYIKSAQGQFSNYNVWFMMRTTADLYSGNSRFLFLPGHRLICFSPRVGISHFLQTKLAQCLDYSLTAPFQMFHTFISHPTNDLTQSYIRQHRQISHK